MLNNEMRNFIRFPTMTTVRKERKFDTVEFGHKEKRA